MNEKRILINPNLEVFSKMGVNNLKIKKIILDTRYKKVTFNCFVSSLNCIKDIDVIYKNISSKFQGELDVEFLTSDDNLNLNEEELKDVVDRAVEKLKTKNSTSRSFLCFYKLHINGKNIKIELNDKNAIFILNELKVNLKIEQILSEYGLRNYYIDFIDGNFSDTGIAEIEKKIDMSIKDNEKKNRKDERRK